MDWPPHQRPSNLAREGVAGVDGVNAGSWASGHAADGPGHSPRHADVATTQPYARYSPQLHCSRSCALRSDLSPPQKQGLSSMPDEASTHCKGPQL